MTDATPSAFNAAMSAALKRLPFLKVSLPTFREWARIAPSASSGFISPKIMCARSP